MVTTDELEPGSIVKIRDVGQTLRAVAVRHAPTATDFRVRKHEVSYDCLVDGQIGQCLEPYDTESYIVRTVEGHVAAVPLHALEEWVPPKATEGGFDVAWPHDDEGAGFFSQVVAQALLDRGYCVVQMFLGREEHQEALDSANNAGEPAEFKEELVVDFMGRNSYTKARKLQPDDLTREPTDSLGQCERQLSQVGMMVGPLTPSCFNFETIGRSASFVRTRFSSRSEAEKLAPRALESDDIEDGAVSSHIRFVQARKICMLYIVDCEGGEVWFYKADGSQVSVPASKNRMVIFRHDQLSYSFQPLGKSVALQSWLIRDVPGFEVTQVTGGLQEVDKVMEVKGPVGQEGRKFQILSMQTRFPGNSVDPEKYWTMCSQCTDCDSEWPFMRFESNLYYANDPNAALQGKSYTNHGGFLAYHELVHFGNDFFNISEKEAFSMSWNQRMSCEVGYDTLHKAGWTRESLQGKHIGTYVGDVGSDWHSMTGFASLVAWDPDLTATSVHSSVVPARLAHVFNMLGPTMTFDTACSASLVATHHAHLNMINFHAWDMPDDGSLCGGTNSLAPSGFIGNCSANMLSHIGRSFTYDRTADGYQRGEGTAFLYAKLSAEYKHQQDRLACLAGSCANQDGRSASLTAPNGPSQQAVLKHSLRFAGIDPESVTVVECHGTGTALGDPIEVGAIMAVMDGERDDPLPHTSAKSNISHLESAAGIAGLLKCLIILLHSGATPNVHLRALNAHLESAGFPQLFEVELVPTELNAGYAGVSSFGFGGTNSRGDLYAKALAGPSSRTVIQPERIDLISVRCPKCLGDMCGRCGVAVPSFCPKVKHCCELVRDEFADYEVCSNCYKGDIRHGSAIEDTAKCDPSYVVNIVGSWSGWSQMDEMEQVDENTYVCAVSLGETRCEMFQLCLFENAANSIHPVTSNADESIRVEGPDDDGAGKNWLIDGRDKNVPSGSIYQIEFHWGETKSIRWEVVDEVPAFPLGKDFRHSYFITGSWIQWEMQEMRPGRDMATSEVTFQIGHNGKEEFQIVRDKDWRQVIYPAEVRAERSDIPVRGPDGQGSGKNWQVRGSKRENVKVTLTIIDGQITVAASSPSTEKVWTNVTDSPYHTYHITGFFNNWSLTPMVEDTEKKGAFKFILIAQDTLEHFQVVVDEDWKQTLHPSHPDCLCGQDIVQGPDDEGDGLNWMILGEIGSTWEITVDPSAEDKRYIVSWKLQSPAMLADS